jgi:hypothetical protein
MPLMHVLLDEQGEVIGTALAQSVGAGAEVSGGFLARPNQKVVQVTIDDEVASLDAASLHRTIKERFLATATPVTNESILAQAAKQNQPE